MADLSPKEHVEYYARLLDYTLTGTLPGTPAADLQERLCIAAHNGLVESIRALVEQGANVVQYDREGLTALPTTEMLRQCG
jgi:ankyrin repeat protein